MSARVGHRIKELRFCTLYKNLRVAQDFAKQRSEKTMLTRWNTNFCAGDIKVYQQFSPKNSAGHCNLVCDSTDVEIVSHNGDYKVRFCVNLYYTNQHANNVRKAGILLIIDDEEGTSRLTLNLDDVKDIWGPRKSFAKFLELNDLVPRIYGTVAPLSRAKSAHKIERREITDMLTFVFDNLEEWGLSNRKIFDTSLPMVLSVVRGFAMAF